MNMDVDALFQERFKRFSEEFVRYAQYMASGGLLIVMLFLMGLLSLYYRSLVDMIPSWFPLSYVLAFVLALFVTKSPHRTFLLEADLLFLTPVETRMSRYFQKAGRYNFFIQSIGLFIVLLLLSPLYQAKTGATGGPLWFYWGVPFVLKGWNLYSSWIFLRLPDKKREQSYSLARFCFTYLVLAWVLSGGQLLTYHHVPYAGLLFILIVIWFHFKLQAIKQKHRIQWYRLLEMETRLRSRFYRIVNQFKDVPSLQNEVKTRAWLIPVTKIVSYRQSHAARQLFLKTFLRSGGYAGVYLRLLVLSALLVLVLPNVYAKAIVALLFLFMSGIQFAGLWNYHRRRNMYSLLPINEEQQKHAFLWLRRTLLAIQAAVCVFTGLF